MATNTSTAWALVGDPTRQRLLIRLRRRPHGVGELAKALGVTQPAVSQHLRRLRGARLVGVTAVGTRRLYHLDPAGVAALRRWVDLLWDDALTAYARSFDTPHPDSDR